MPTFLFWCSQLIGMQIEDRYWELAALLVMTVLSIPLVLESLFGLLAVAAFVFMGYVAFQYEEYSSRLLPSTYAALAALLFVGLGPFLLWFTGKQGAEIVSWNQYASVAFFLLSAAAVHFLRGHGEPGHLVALPFASYLVLSLPALKISETLAGVAEAGNMCTSSYLASFCLLCPHLELGSSSMAFCYYGAAAIIGGVWAGFVTGYEFGDIRPLKVSYGIFGVIAAVLFFRIVLPVYM